MKELLGRLAVVILVGFGIVSCQESEWYKKSQVADAAQVQREETPHIIRRSPDGCAVYAFKAGDNYHYFTRCSSTTTTEHTISCNKNKQCPKTEEIITENK